MDKHAIVHYSIHKRIILNHAKKFQCTGKYNFLFLGATNDLYSIHKRIILDPVVWLSFVDYVECILYILYNATFPKILLVLYLDYRR